MRRLAVRSDMSLYFRSSVLALTGLAAIGAATAALAQSAPETLRINVEPAEPGIRSVTLNKKYRPIINRDDKGVVIDTMGSSNSLPPCEIKLEITLENSRVLHRDADICSGSTLLVDVTSNEKPGAVARVVGTGSGVAAGPSTSAPDQPVTSTPAVTAVPSGQSDSQDQGTVSSGLDPVDAQPGGLEPLEQVDTPISVPSGQTDTAALPGSLETAVQNRLDQTGSPGQANSQPVLIPASDARTWIAEPGSQPGALSLLQHTVPQTDDRDFRAQCGTQSGYAAVTFQQAPAGLTEGMPQTVFITAGDFSATYNAFGSSSNNEAGVSLPEITLEMTDPLWQALIQQSELSITVESMPAYTVSLKGSATPVRLFVATCALAQQIVSDNGLPPGQDPGSDLACTELGRIRSVEAERPGEIVFRNASQEAVDINWVDYRGGERRYARLEPGQILEQQTYMSHAWTVRGASGQCRGIYVSQTPYREVVLKGAPRGFANPNGLSGPAGGQFPSGPVPPGSVGGANQQIYPQQAGRANVADYLCTAGIDLNVVFSPDGRTATVAEMGYGAVTLQRQGSANTFYFESQGHVLKGQIQNATWSRPGLRDVFCARR
ncbi:hypothetical protein [Labrenzia sp. PHM005]|uniref:VHL beta domain-containing protein n=1 Tax=Labrenzia sp. PHM005 TaxID=2590016 RepID=UPI001AD8A4D8|nr:hypothetical protein [Labrenzia sp. PHM005]